ncbi:MAG: MoaD/ThiS family protein [Ruminococcaceae bacterium]|nr:MoaD/ThiS family protein [Oscillospiraceae bacterium]MBR3595397.1 MoaD/ThiS family protein [Clostridia bacterium]
MVKVKIFGVLRSTTGLSELDTNAKNVNGIFEEISEIMEKRYYEDLKKQQEDTSEYKKKRNAALTPHKELKFKDAIVYVDGERCMRKGKKLPENGEVWLLSPAAGG